MFNERNFKGNQLGKLECAKAALLGCLLGFTEHLLSKPLSPLLCVVVEGEHAKIAKCTNDR